MDCKIQDRKDYSKKLICYKAKAEIRYYSKRQIKALYPYRNFIVAGEIGNRSGVQNGVAENLDGQPLPVYKEKTHDSLTESIVGYTAIGSHTYLEVVKNDLPGRVFVFVFVLFLIAGSVVIFGLLTR